MKSQKKNLKGTNVNNLWSWEYQFDNTKLNDNIAMQEFIQYNISNNFIQLCSQILTGNDPSNIEKILQIPKNANPSLWLIEQMKQFLLEINLLLTQLKGICNAESCPNMKSTEDFNYLCAAHEIAQECNAINYMIHNIDSSSIILYQLLHEHKTNLDENQDISKQLSPLVRRLYRIFSHTYFNHKEVFEEFEKQMFLNLRFTTFSRMFQMIPEKLLIIPDLKFEQQTDQYV